MGYPNDGTQANLYTAEGYDNTYKLDPGVCILPLAEDPPTDPDELQSWSPVVVLRLHAPYRIRKMSHLSEKKNNPPPLPSSADQGAFVFMGGTVNIVNKLNTTFRNFDWSVGAEYLFVENCVSREVDGYILGTPTFTWESSTLNAQSGAGIGLIGSTITPPAGAVTQAGSDVLVGYNQGLSIVGNQITGELKTIWGYNTASYYPGTLVYSNLANGGPQVVPSQSQG